MFRFFYIIGLLIKYGFIFLLVKLNLYRKPKHKILRNFFEEAGGSFIKFGQILALRADVLSKDFALEMLDMFDNVGPFPYEDVENIFRSELGAKPQDIFKDFQKEPFASASFGQVHGAKLEDDHIVIVKVLRPDIEEKVEADFLIVGILAFIADLFFKVEALTWKEFVDEFKKWTTQELDYRIEAENTSSMQRNTSVNENVVVPKVYPHLSTKRILVEDYIEGIPLSRIIRGLKDGRLTSEDLEDMGVNIKNVPKIMTYELLREFFTEKYFHADPHPGNILVLLDGRVAFLDFGIVGTSITHNKADFIKFTRSASVQDLNTATYHFANYSSDELKSIVGSAIPASFSEEQVDEFMKQLADHFSKAVGRITKGSAKKLEEMKTDYAMLFIEIAKAAQKYKIRFPRETALFFRTLVIAGFLAKELDREFKFTIEIQNFFKDYPEEELLKTVVEQPPFKRISRERAVERLNSWLSYLVEIDPALYQVVKDSIKAYN